jgi:hypothetical protein
MDHTVTLEIIFTNEMGQRSRHSYLTTDWTTTELLLDYGNGNNLFVLQSST